MKNLRRYGAAPFRVAVVHGGPGATGEMAPVARELSSRNGVLEPLQTATSVNGQIAELTRVLTENADLPVTLIGHSWGAWLSMMTAAGAPALVAKLILVSSGPFEEQYASGIATTRLSRLTPDDRSAAERAMRILNDPTARGKDAALARLGAFLSRADAYDPIPDIEGSGGDSTRPDAAIFEGVWQEAAEMRRSGKLLELATRIRCPVIAIHGDYDPHPAEGVRKPLAAVLKDFRFVLLRHCGHEPWHERQARHEFFRIIAAELGKPRPGRTQSERNRTTRTTGKHGLPRTGTVRNQPQTDR